MRIQDLLEAPFTTDVVDKRTNRDLRQFRQRNRDKNPEGAFSVVKPDKDPHMVKKSSRGATPSDFTEGFKAFIMFLKNNDFENIHFPRVYEVKTIQGKDGYEIDKFKVEKLIDGYHIDKDLMRNYVRNILPDEATEGYDESEIDHSLLAMYIHDAVNGRTRPFKDDTLNDACNIISRALHATGGNNDIHQNNIMFRQTGHGIQVVINDPIFVNR